jgi:hypothetical protein
VLNIGFQYTKKFYGLSITVPWSFFVRRELFIYKYYGALRLTLKNTSSIAQSRYYHWCEADSAAIFVENKRIITSARCSAPKSVEWSADSTIFVR